MDTLKLENSNRTYHHVQERMAFLPNYYRWIFSRLLRYLSGDVIELGCGAGLGIDCYLSVARHVYAIDYNEHLLNQIRSRYSSEEVTTICSDLAHDDSRLDSLRADAVIMMDVIEHFADDVGVMRRAAKMANPGGYVIAKVPGNTALYSAMDEASGHFRRYDAQDLTEVGQTAGLKLVKLWQFNRLGALAYRFRNHSRQNFSKSFPVWQLKIIDQMIPFMALVDRVALGKGLSIIGVFTQAHGRNVM